ncbi:TPA: helix-turn-helix domain-containing protein, partial [Enterococcus faecium]
IGQTELVRDLQLRKIAITRETLVKIESGRQHIKLDQLRAIRDVLQVSYEDLLQ